MGNGNQVKNKQKLNSVKILRNSKSNAKKAKVRRVALKKKNNKNFMCGMMIKHHLHVYCFLVIEFVCNS